MAALDDGVMIYPSHGHGSPCGANIADRLESTIGYEKATNPFLRVTQPEVIATASRYTGKSLSDPVDVLAAIREWKNNF